MKCLKLEYADAFLLGPGAEPPLLGMYWVPRIWSMAPTAAGNRVVVPVPGSFPLSEDYRWPVLPLVKHRGGYFTATARQALEYGFPVYDSSGGCIRGWFEQLPRTKHRVFWMDRNAIHLVVDVIKRPKPERLVIRKYIPVQGDPHTEVAQLLFGKACPKCGGRELKPKWGNGELPGCGPLGLCRWVEEPLRSNHIHVTCQACHYEWLEEPLDATETA